MVSHFLFTHGRDAPYKPPLKLNNLFGLTKKRELWSLFSMLKIYHFLGFSRSKYLSISLQRSLKKYLYFVVVVRRCYVKSIFVQLYFLSVYHNMYMYNMYKYVNRVQIIKYARVNQKPLLPLPVYTYAECGKFHC